MGKRTSRKPRRRTSRAQTGKRVARNTSARGGAVVVTRRVAPGCNDVVAVFTDIGEATRWTSGHEFGRDFHDVTVWGGSKGPHRVYQYDDAYAGLVRNRGGERLDMLEHEVEHELTQAWASLRGGDIWRARDGLAHLDLLEEFATPSQRTELRSLRSALKQANTESWHEVVANRSGAPPLYRAIAVDEAGHRRPLGAGPLSDMRNMTMAMWLGDPSMRSAYVLDRLGHSHLTLEPRDRKKLQANRISNEMLKDWNRVNLELRQAERGGDPQQIAAAKKRVREVEVAMNFARMAPNSGHPKPRSSLAVERIAQLREQSARAARDGFYVEATRLRVQADRAEAAYRNKLRRPKRST